MWDELGDLLEELPEDTLILTHSRADVDAVASAAALQKRFGWRAHVPDGVSAPAKKVAEHLKYTESPLFSNTVVVVDTSSKKMLGSGVSVYENAKKKIIIDHHSENTMEGLLFVDPSFVSTTEILYEVFRRKGWLDGEVSLLLAAGILTDSVGLSIAGPDTLRRMADLLERAGVGMEEVYEMIRWERDVSERIARLKAAGRCEIHRFGDFLVVISEVGSFESSAASALISLGADVAIVYSDERVVGRSTGSVDLAKIFREVAEELGGEGGGHPSAAGMQVENPRKAVLMVLEKISEGRSGHKVYRPCP